MATQIQRVAVIGTGVIGASWTALFWQEASTWRPPMSPRARKSACGSMLPRPGRRSRRSAFRRVPRSLA